MHPPISLIDFCQLLESDKNLQYQVKSATNPKEIVDLAQSLGHDFTNNELRIWSKELSAPYFPWSQMGNEWRRNFFK